MWQPQRESRGEADDVGTGRSKPSWLVAVGDRVSITLPNNRTTPGVVSSVGAVATRPSTTRR